jgi:membrane-associated protease RseP (regulator of RpoE activity)
MSESRVPTITRIEALRAAVDQVMTVRDSVTEDRHQPAVVFRGRLKTEPGLAYDRLAPAFDSQSLTLLLRHEDNEDLAIGVSQLKPPGTPNPRVNAVLFLLTFLSVGYAGLINGASYLQPEARSLDELQMWAPGAILLGVGFAASFLGILLAHEFGHYLAARRHGTPVSLPYFIPLPAPPLGTMGAAIRLLAPPRNRRVLLDIGMAGPLAGLAVAVPVLLIGLMLSHVAPLPATVDGFANLTLEGNSIFYLAAKFLARGELLPAPASYGDTPLLLYWARYLLLGEPTPIGGRDVMLHPMAWAGWAGLLVTALNLIPAGQLDGGHAAYVLFGRRAGRMLPFLVGGLLLLGGVWNGWWLWAALVLLLGRTYAQPLDDITPLDGRRRWVAILGLVLFVVLFMPVPLRTFGPG